MQKVLELLRWVFDTRNLLVYAHISAGNTFDFSRLDVQIDRIRVARILILLHTHTITVSFYDDMQAILDRLLYYNFWILHVFKFVAPL